MSMKLPPAAVKASRMASDVEPSAVHPKTFPPRQIGDTLNDEMRCMGITLGGHLKVHGQVNEELLR